MYHRCPEKEPIDFGSAAEQVSWLVKKGEDPRGGFAERDVSGTISVSATQRRDQSVPASFSYENSTFEK